MGAAATPMAFGESIRPSGGCHRRAGARRAHHPLGQVLRDGQGLHLDAAHLYAVRRFLSDRTLKRLPALRMVCCSRCNRRPRTIGIGPRKSRRMRSRTETKWRDGRGLRSAGVPRACPSAVGQLCPENAGAKPSSTLPLKRKGLRARHGGGSNPPLFRGDTSPVAWIRFVRWLVIRRACGALLLIADLPVVSARCWTATCSLHPLVWSDDVARALLLGVSFSGPRRRLWRAARMPASPSSLTGFRPGGGLVDAVVAVVILAVTAGFCWNALVLYQDTAGQTVGAGFPQEVFFGLCASAPPL